MFAARADLLLFQFTSKLYQHGFAIGCPVCPAQLILGDICTDQPISHRKADIDSPTSLRSQMLVYLPDGGYKRIEIHFVCLLSHEFSLIL